MLPQGEDKTYVYGVMQAIGYKEFAVCFDELNQMSEAKRNVLFRSLRSGRMTQAIKT